MAVATAMRTVAAGRRMRCRPLAAGLLMLLLMAAQCAEGAVGDVLPPGAPDPLLAAQPGAAAAGEGAEPGGGSSKASRLDSLLSAATKGRRLQLLSGLLNAAGSPSTGTASDVPPPKIKGGGTFVLDKERHTDPTRNLTAELTPGGGIFVNYVNLTFGVPFNGTRNDGSGMWPNSTAAETHYAVQYCPGALFFPSTEYCADKFDVLGNFRPVFYGDTQAGNAMDRFNSDGVATWTGEMTDGAQIQGDAGPVIVRDVGWIYVEAFTLLVETDVAPSPVTGEYPLPTIVAMSAVSYANFTVVPDPVMPILDPPQDFFDTTLNVTLETPTNDSHVFFTLQPPFVNDKNGTWCPHMGVWCSN